MLARLTADADAETDVQSTLLDRAGSHLLVHTPLAGQKTAMVSLVVRGSAVTLVVRRKDFRAPAYSQLREFAVPGADADVLANPVLCAQCDLALFLYDTSDPTSFSYAASLHAKMTPSGPPCLFVAAKADLKTQHQVWPHPRCPLEGCSSLLLFSLASSVC